MSRREMMGPMKGSADCSRRRAEGERRGWRGDSWRRGRGPGRERSTGGRRGGAGGEDVSCAVGGEGEWGRW